MSDLDLVRAMVVTQQKTLQDLSLAPIDVWNKRMGPERLERLAYSWGRRWAYLSPMSIGLQEMFRSLSRRALTALAHLDEQFQEGLITEEEALSHLIDNVASRGWYGGDIPPAWLSRHSPQLDTSAPGHALVGPAGAGKRTFLGRLPFPEREVNIDNFHGGGFSDPKYEARPETSYASLSPGLVCGWSWAHKLEPALVRYAIEMANDSEARFHLVIAATPDEWEQIKAVAPQASTLRVLMFEPPADDELIPLWLCQRPMLEDRLGRLLDLSWLMSRLARLRRYGSPASILRGLLPTRNAVGSLVLPEADLFGEHEASTPRPLSKIGWDRLTRKDGEWLQQLLPAPDHFSRAMRLDAALSGVHHPEGERNGPYHVQIP
ncbi:hypothetical protein [Corallococcus carmarthensis]|uniref:hypothetical protein n=1 Tax=Corallococcus carmarthensis TaxID=2316728 RepID=UPI00148D8816|nr:hypothetical protein [Corallococcus carmarthensis]NOK15628.1 hypothetical protein [Corallococcus carmarthensis]